MPDDERVQWFGEPWGAPICDPGQKVPTPLGAACVECEEGFTIGDQGFLIHAPGIAHPHLPPSRVAYHLNCFLRNIGIREVL